jgi:hypothetical protein
VSHKPSPFSLFDDLVDLHGEDAVAKHVVRPGTVRKPAEPEPLAQDDWDAKPVYMRVRGERREFFTIGHLAAALGKTPVTLRRWEQKGWLPRPVFRGPTPRNEQVPGRPVKGKRLYTREMVEGIVRIAHEEGVLNLVHHQSMAHTRFPERTRSLYESILKKER